jgi:preprotein translocase subunit Sss1
LTVNMLHTLIIGLIGFVAYLLTADYEE